MNEHDKCSISAYEKTKVITSRILLLGAVHHCGARQPWFAPNDEALLAEAYASYERVAKVLKDEYEPKVWFGGLQALVRASSVRGHSATFDGVSLLSFVLAGRAMQTISNSADRSITIICDETGSEPRSGIQGIHATEEEAIALLRAATSAWVVGRVELREDARVSI